MKKSKCACVAGHHVTCLPSGVLVVDDRISVLPKGTHAILDQLGQAKPKIVAWWKEQRV